jgi:hypothetical protein
MNVLKIAPKGQPDSSKFKLNAVRGKGDLWCGGTGGHK